jgi:CPA1 family monovalent cation:H+ antiporter
MDLFTVIAILTTICALFAYVNFRYVKLPTTIGLMLIALLTSIAVLIVGQFSPTVLQGVEELISEIDFPQVVLEVMLSFLLFAGALHTDMALMREQKWSILSFATIGVLMSTFLIGALFYYLVYSLPAAGGSDFTHRPHCGAGNFERG